MLNISVNGHTCVDAIADGATADNSAIINVCDARHGTEFSGESPPWAELKRFTSLDKGKFVRACHEGRYHV